MTVKEAIDELKYSRDMCYFDPSTGKQEGLTMRTAREWLRHST